MSINELKELLSLILAVAFGAVAGWVAALMCWDRRFKKGKDGK